MPFHVEGRFRGDQSKYEDIPELFWVIMIKPGTTMWGANEDPEVLDEGGFSSHGYASSLGLKRRKTYLISCQYITLETLLKQTKHKRNTN